METTYLVKLVDDGDNQFGVEFMKVPFNPSSLSDRFKGRTLQEAEENARHLFACASLGILIDPEPENEVTFLPWLFNPN